EVREYILDGVSRRRARSLSASAERERAAIRMPAFRAALRHEEIDDLVAYVMAVAQIAPIANPGASRGRDLVRRFQCESCHGVVGSGGVLNPGSLKGFVPGWVGADDPELVQNGQGLRRWVLDGGSARAPNTGGRR